MKKRTLLKSSLLLTPLLFASPIKAQVSDTLYDQSPWANDQILKLFSNAWDDGQRNYPTKEEFEEIGLTFDLEFVRSHTRQRPIYMDADKDVVSDINHDRRLWCNLPGGYGKELGGYPSATFDNDAFSLWNYTTIFGAWNYGFLKTPGSWVDAAHKNGVRIYGGLKFFEGWNDDGSEGAFLNFISTKADNGDYDYKYSRAFVNSAAFFGYDGYNYNSEGSSWQDEDWVKFHAEVAKIARELELDNFGIGQYTQRATADPSIISYLYGSKENGKVFDCMLNYSGDKLAWSGVSTSIAAVEAEGLPMDGIYQGQLLVGCSGDNWTQMNTETTKKMNICIWGEHDQSRFFQFRVGVSPTNIQENYQLLLEKAFSGANRNPLHHPAINNAWGSFQVANATDADKQLDNAPGFASMVPERASVGGQLPFETHFSLGNGENYFYKGKISNGSWYNMSMQDVVPTYRWLVTKKDDMKTFANDVDVRFTYEDAYIGGSSIRLSSADGAAGTDVVLYRSKIASTTGNVKVDLALKGAAGDSHLSVLLKKQGSDAWIEVPAGELTGTSWETKNLTVAGISANDTIENIGLRVNGAGADYKMLVGWLKISDDYTKEPASLKEESLLVELTQENTQSLGVKLTWEPDWSSYKTSVDKFGMVYNDEIDVDHFEVFWKEGEEGKVKEIGRTSQWAAYVGNIPLEQGVDAFVGVRAVSTDLKSYSPVQWVQVSHSDGVLPEPVVEDPYGKTWMSSRGTQPSLEAITENIWFDNIVTTGATKDLAYQPTKNEDTSGQQYYYAENDTLIITQGQQIAMTIRGHDAAGGESLKYDFIYAYIDYDGNYSFLDKDEELAGYGNLNAAAPFLVNPGASANITVPEDAKVGPSRLRIVASDAWTAHPGPVGGTVKGYSIDFPVVIKGNNESRVPAKTYKDYQDKGDPEEPEGDLGGKVDAIESVGSDAAASAVNVIGSTAYFTNADKAWFYDMTGRCVKFVKDAASVVDIDELTPGVYIVKMQKGQVARSVKIVK